MPTIAETIAIRRRGEHLTLLVDGKEFPWHVAEDDLLTTTSTQGPGTVTLTIPAMRIVLDDEADPEVPECAKHDPVQHRDGRERWCDSCGLTADGRDPVPLGGARFGS